MDQLEQLRGVLLLGLALLSFGTICGMFLVYKYKVAVNCKALSNVTNEVHDIKEQRLPYFVTMPSLTAHCLNLQDKCLGAHEKRESALTAQIDKLEDTLLTRLEKMDDERNASREEEGRQKVKRVEAFTKMAATVETLSIRFEKVEKKLEDMSNGGLVKR